MPIKGGFVGMVDRGEFDEWLRCRAAASGATRLTGAYESITRDADGVARVQYRAKGEAQPRTLRARSSSAPTARFPRSAARKCRGADKTRFVFAYHEVIETPPAGADRPRSLRDLLSRRALARFLRLDFPAWRHDERRHGQRQQGLFAEKLRRAICATTHGPDRRRNGAPRGRADPPEAAEALGQWPRRHSRGRRGGRRRAGIGRGHLLRDARRPACGRRRRRVPAHGRRARARAWRASAS